MQIEINGERHTLKAIKDEKDSIVYYLKLPQTGQYIKIGGGNPKVSDEKIVIKRAHYKRRSSPTNKRCIKRYKK